MGTSQELIEFSRVDPGALVDALEPLWVARRGEWVNAQPAVTEEDARAAAGAGLFRAFSARGPEVPFVTFVSPDSSRRRPQPGSVGIQHAAGPKAIATLEEMGLGPPKEWVRRQDHPRRGVVWELPEAELPAVVSYALLAAGALSRVVVGDRWFAVVHRRD